MWQLVARPSIVSFTSVLLIVFGHGCDGQEPIGALVRLEEIKRVVVFDIDPSRNPGVYTQSVEEIGKYTHADFDVKTFCKLADSLRSKDHVLHKGGNLLIVFYEDGSEQRMMILYGSAGLRSREGVIFVAANESAQSAFRQEHKRIIDDIFIPQRGR